MAGGRVVFLGTGGALNVERYQSSIVVEEGVVFEGHCRMTKSSPPDVPAAKPQRDLSVVSLEP